MATRTDLFVRWAINPRIIEIMAPSTSLVGQDLVDTVRKLEDQFQGMSYAHLLNASGKEDLGGGLFVGITSALQDAQLFFESQTVSVSTGTITTTDNTPLRTSLRLIDSGATFVTDGVERGDVITNTTDGSVASVIHIVSQTELIASMPRVGSDNFYESGDSYSICSSNAVTVSGGNVVAVDDVQASIETAIGAAFNFITVEKSTSAALLSADTLLLERIEKILRNKLITDPVAGTITVYDDDGITVLLSASIFQDAAGTIPYAGQGSERRERLV